MQGSGGDIRRSDLPSQRCKGRAKGSVEEHEGGRVLAVGPSIMPAVQVDFLEGKVVDAASEIPDEAPVEVSVVLILAVVY
jgi:hypothetical protein